MMSISPLAGHGPYVLFTGSIQIAGHSQSPRGSRARTSTRPYWIDVLLIVVRRADCTGLMTVRVVSFDTTPHAVLLTLVHPVKLNVCALKIADVPIASEVRVGTMYRMPSSIKVLFALLVVISNSPFLRETGAQVSYGIGVGFKMSLRGIRDRRSKINEIKCGRLKPKIKPEENPAKQHIDNLPLHHTSIVSDSFRQRAHTRSSIMTTRIIVNAYTSCSIFKGCLRKLLGHKKLRQTRGKRSRLRARWHENIWPRRENQGTIATTLARQCRTVDHSIIRL